MSNRSRTSWDFLRDFKVIVADRSELRDIVYEIRHAVYCQELGFEPMGAESNYFEMDEFDSRAFHCLVQHRESREYIGCVRVVFSSHHLNHDCGLPFSKLFGQDQKFIRTLQQSHGEQPMIEISRLAIKAEFRKHLICESENDSNIKSLTKLAQGQDNQKLKINMNLVSTSLYFVCALIADSLQLDCGYAMMEKRLLRHLRRFGIHFKQISDFIEHKGSRALFCVGTRSILDNVPLERAAFIHNLREQISPSFVNRLAELRIEYPLIATSSYEPETQLSLSA